MINQAEIVKKHWGDIRGELQKVWGKLTFDDIERTHGDVSAISSLVQQRHGEKPEQFDSKFADLLRRVDATQDMPSDVDHMDLREESRREIEPDAERAVPRSDVHFN